MDLLQYYGVDWLATSCGLIGVWLLGNRNKFGFVLLMVASSSWITFGLIAGSVAVIIGSAVFLTLHLRGLIRWILDERRVADVGR